MLLFPKKKVTPLPKKKVVTSQKVTPSEEVGKGTRNLDDMKYAVVTIRNKYLDNFEEQSIGSTGWFNLYPEWLKIKFYTIKPDFYK